jgi:hypothetical protein
MVEIAKLEENSNYLFNWSQFLRLIFVERNYSGVFSQIKSFSNSLQIKKKKKKKKKNPTKKKKKKKKKKGTKKCCENKINGPFITLHLTAQKKVINVNANHHLIKVLL